MLHEMLLRQSYLPIHGYLCRLDETVSATDAESLLEVYLSDAAIRAALHVGAPNVYAYLSARDFSARRLPLNWQTTLWKYITRMHSRATPYGLFATVGLPADNPCWPPPQQAPTLGIRLDYEFLTVLYRFLLRQPAFRIQQGYFLTNTLDKSVNQPGRPATHYTYTGWVQPRSLQPTPLRWPVPLLQSIQTSPVLDELLALYIPRPASGEPDRDWRTAQELLQVLLTYTTDYGSAVAYLDYLIDNTVLIGQCTPWVTGPSDALSYESVLVSWLTQPELTSDPVLNRIGELLQQWVLIAKGSDPENTSHQPSSAIESQWSAAGRVTAELWSLISTDTTALVGDLPDDLPGDATPMPHITDIPGDYGMQADSFLAPTSSLAAHVGTSSPVILSALEEALAALADLTDSPDTTQLDAFTTAFTRRYEDGFVPLLEVLNPDTGLGYQARGAPYSALLADFPNPDPAPFGFEKSASAPAGDILSAWHRIGCPEAGIVLSPQEISTRYGRHVQQSAGLGTNPASSPSTHTGGYLLGEWVSLTPYFRADTPDQLLTQSQQTLNPVFRIGMAGSASPTALLGRFADGLPDLAGRCRNLMASSAVASSLALPVIEAEINYVPLATPRQGNVLRRPWLRAAEISYMQPPATVPGETHAKKEGKQAGDQSLPSGTDSPQSPRQIPLSDLYVGCPGGRVVLYWRSEQKWVIPHLASAHNKLWGDEVYQFLLDVQTTWGQWSARWSWGAYESLHRLPRVQIGPLIVAPARWRITTADKQTSLSVLRTELVLPRRVVLLEGDNRLLMDLASHPGQRLLDEARSKLTDGNPYLHLEEWLPPVGGDYVQETLYGLPNPTGFIEQVVKNLPPVPLAECRLLPTAVRLQVPGQGWWYAKLYGSVLLAESVLNRMEETLEADTDWFFIRYADPDPHLRFRWRVCGDNSNPVWPVRLTQLLSDLVRDGQLSRVELATYHPEWERYGRVAYPQTESLFCRDSRFVRSQLNRLTESDEEEKLLAALRSAYHFIQASGLLKADKRAFWERGQRQYLLEQPDEKAARTWLNTFYRRLSGAIDVWLSKPLSDTEKSYYAQTEVALTALRDHYQRGEDAPLVYETVVTSLLHMHLNRWFTMQPRRCELLVYHCLTRWSLIPDQHKRNLKAIE